MKSSGTAGSTSMALIPAGNWGALALAPGSLGNLDAYISAVNRIPLVWNGSRLRRCSTMSVSG